MVNPKQQEFSWSRGEVSSRIDFIWLANELTSGLFESEMQDMDICTHSDHKAVTAKLVLDYLVVPSSAAKVRRSGQKRTVFLYDKATKDDWDDYRAELERRLCGKVNIAEINNSSRSDRNREEEQVMNNWWDQISNGILTAAKRTLPKKRIDNTMPNKRRPKETRLGKTLTQLGRWIRIGKLNLKLGYLKDNITDINAEIDYINKQHGIHIEEVQEE
jgi:hypothetical protein